MIAYDKAHTQRLVVIVTGKGELRRRFEERYATLQLQNVRVATAWLSTKDYCCLLACADVGVSLHASTSGLDLPMKVVDMFGVGLPVLQLRFPCVAELVEDGVNGVLFEDAASLARALAHRHSGLRPRRSRFEYINVTWPWRAPHLHATKDARMHCDSANSCCKASKSE